jgi:indolepyruvate ferredoxin oxidoreductase
MNAPLDHPLAQVELDDKYVLEQGRVFLTGTQALVRLPMLQRRRDVAAGLNTAGYISGYRGSPLGAYDQALGRARKFLEQHHIRFQPGVNEDLAATALWGSQQLNLFPGARYDGVFGIWYGKGPGVDRSGDVFRHANGSGTSRHGGVLALAGDDPGAKSSTQAAQSDFIFKAVGIPVLAPASVQEYLDLGVHGFAMSRYSGCWVAMKCVTDIVESAASVDVATDRVQVVLPADFEMPADGLNGRWPEFTGFVEQEKRLYHRKLYAALAYARANRLNHEVWSSREGRLGIVAVGKAYDDVRQALDDLAIDERLAREIGLRLFKVSMPWPLEPTLIADFCKGLREVLVVEEKRQLVEYQLKEQLYNLPDSQRPRIVGKFDQHGEWEVPQARMLLPASGELSPSIVAKAIADRLRPFHTSAAIDTRLAAIDADEQALVHPPIRSARLPYFCAGCPHNTSTRVPEGSRALAGIGCHYMAQWMDRSTATFSHMGGEGVAWLGQAPFTDTPHVFANLGDGTYFHSGIMAIRAAVSARAPMTYKILYNDAVAMTGGQRIDGPLTVPQLTRQVAAEGVERIVVVTDQPEKYGPAAGFAPGVTVEHRDELDRVQRELRGYAATSVLIYDQTCAAEKRRRRKRGTFPDPAVRVFINEAVCEGCGDCSVASNCVAVEPLETAFGRKRRINQSSCNKDYSCVKGFCPSFVTVERAQLRKGSALETQGAGRKAAADPDPPPAPDIPQADTPYGILVTGIGGTGVVTIGQILGMAAHLEHKGVTVLDVAGLAQKNGAVMSFVRIAREPALLHAPRIATGGATAIIGCDAVTTLGAEAVSKMRQGVTRAAVNCSQIPTAEFTQNPDWRYPQAEIEAQLAQHLGVDGFSMVDAQRLASALLGDAIAANMFMLGYAWQKGLVPLSDSAIERAIELNEVSVELNKRAFLWGRLAAHDLRSVEAAAAPATSNAQGGSATDSPLPLDPSASPDPRASLEQLIAHRVAHLTAYQDKAYADRYAALVERVRSLEKTRTGGTLLTAAVARYYAKLLAYKDEYEVARMHSDPAFRARLNAVFADGYRLRFHLAPPVLNKRDPVSGVPRKSTFGPWMMPVFRLLARCRGLRGSWLDPFARLPERRMERDLIRQYETTVEELLSRLSAENSALAVEIASIPEEIRGFGHVKERHLTAAKAKEAELLGRLREPSADARAVHAL